MIVKLVLAAAVMAVGVLGRTIPQDDMWINSFVASSYCDRDKIPQVQAAIFTFKQCLQNIYGAESFRNEIRQAAIANDQAKLMKLFCSKTSELKTCTRPLFTSMAPCYTANGLRNAQKELDDSIDLICYNDGAKLLLFIKEGGQQCIEEKKTEIESCKQTKTSEITRLIGVHGSGPAIPDNERCKVDRQENTCAVAALKTCTNPAPGKLIEELVNAVSIKCNETNQQADTGPAQEGHKNVQIENGNENLIDV